MDIMTCEKPQIRYGTEYALTNERLSQFAGQNILTAHLFNENGIIGLNPIATPWEGYPDPAEFGMQNAPQTQRYLGTAGKLFRYHSQQA